MIDPDDLRDLFKRDPKKEARILDSLMPSDFFPKAGDFFRVRTATTADRSYMGDIWECIGSQSYCAVGRKVLDTYCGAESKHVGDIKSFVAGDVIFYDCSEVWAAVQKQQAERAEAANS